MRRAKWTTLLALAVLLLMGAPASSQQVPLAPTAIPQFVQELPKLITDVPVIGGQAIDISMCEFQTTILPTGTVFPVGSTAQLDAQGRPLTWVWGYENATTCPDPAVVAHPYIGPVVLAEHDKPTQMTYYNNLPDATGSRVLAYKKSTDQTLQWADPFSLAVAKNAPPATGYQYPPPFLAPPPELNDCNFEASLLPLTATLLAGPFMPTPCVDNYGLLAQMAPATTYAAPVPAAVHLHGGEIPAFLDGGPDAWWTPNGIKGHGFYTNPNVPVGPNAAVYTYPNGQEPAPTWFHDHVLGATRLNVYAGIAGAYYQYDTEFPLAAGLHPLGLPNGGATEPIPGLSLIIPLVVQDRIFDSNGQLFFPAAGLNPQHPFWVPEFVGDTIVVNGKAWPKVSVEPKRYRFLFLNGSNARSYEMFLVNPLTKIMGPSLYVIGNDQGYLDLPAKIDPNVATNNKLVMMPGERYEVIIDFTNFAGQKLQLRNTAKTPYPGGAASSGSTTARIVQFDVSATCPSGKCGTTDASYDPATGAAIRNPMIRLATTAGTLAPGVTVNKRRVLTLNEVIAAGGPVEILMNNTKYTGHDGLGNSRPDFTPIQTQAPTWYPTYYSELPQEGDIEEWDIVNLTADAHPIHPHLVAFQVLNRQKLQSTYATAYALAFPAGVVQDAYGPPCDYNFPMSAGSKCVAPPKTKIPAGYVTPVGGNPDPTFYLTGGILPPAPAEVGWKDTVMSLPGQVLRMLVRFAPTDVATNVVGSYAFSPDGGHGYVWHCHIIDHEDNEMMRPFSVIPLAGATRTFVQGADY